MRRLALLLVLPLIWFPLIGLLLVLVPGLPWYAWVFGAVFWFLLARRIRNGRAPAGELIEGAARFSPTRGRGGY